MNVVKEFEHKGLTIKIVVDDSPSSPREDCNLGTILYKGNRQYVLGDEEASEEEMEAIQNSKDNICLPVYANIHGNISLSTSEFSCPWDSGQCGVIFVSKAKIKSEWKVKRISSKLLETVLSNLRFEIETYSHYCNGEVYGYEVIDTNGEVVDSCYGYFGNDTDYMESEAKSQAEYYSKVDKSGKLFADRYGIVTKEL